MSIWQRSMEGINLRDEQIAHLNAKSVKDSENARVNPIWFRAAWAVCGD